MIVVKTELKEVKGKGIGLFAKELIKKGSVVWKYDPIVDIEIDKEKIPKEAKEFYDTYAVEYEKGKLRLNSDNARFINHSDNPAIKHIKIKKQSIATRDILPGEEITINYEEVDVNEVDF